MPRWKTTSGLKLSTYAVVAYLAKCPEGKADIRWMKATYRHGAYYHGLTTGYLDETISLTEAGWELARKQNYIPEHILSNLQAADVEALKDE